VDYVVGTSKAIVSKGRIVLAKAAELGDDLGPCPFCGRSIVADLRDNSVAHALPTCATFDALDVLEFVTAVNKAREASRLN
jgi:hypothetical protein